MSRYGTMKKTSALTKNIRSNQSYKRKTLAATKPPKISKK